MTPPKDRASFRLVIICALEEEREAVVALLDTKYRTRYGKADGDSNSYRYGELGGQPIVIVGLFEMGVRNATEVGRMMKFSFKNIMLAFLVGITGGVPFKSDGSQTGVRLGDVIISTSTVQYDQGKQNEHRFETIAAANDGQSRLPGTAERVKRFLGYAKTKDVRETLLDYTRVDFKGLGNKRRLENPGYKHPFEDEKYKHPGRQNDHIYRSDHIHMHRDPRSCHVCDKGVEDCREAQKLSCADLGCQPGDFPLGKDREETEIHFGPYASGDGVQKSARRRNEIVEQHGALAIEMVGPGVRGTFPTIVVKGVVDYADSHKNKVWRLYSAARAALCTAAIIEEMDLGANSTGSTVVPRAHSYPEPHQDAFSVPLSLPDVAGTGHFVARQPELQEMWEALTSNSTRRSITIHGLGGIGKTQLAVAYGQDHTSTLDTVDGLRSLYAEQGKLAEAEEMYQRALQGKEMALGRDHTSTLQTVNNLGLLYADQGKLAEAEEMYQRAASKFPALPPSLQKSVAALRNHLTIS